MREGSYFRELAFRTMFALAGIEEEDQARKESLISLLNPVRSSVIDTISAQRGAFPPLSEMAPSTEISAELKKKYQALFEIFDRVAMEEVVDSETIGHAQGVGEEILSILDSISP